GAALEGLEDRAALSGAGAESAPPVDVDEDDVVRDREIGDRHPFERAAHELAPDRGGGAAAGLLLAEGFLRVVADPDPGEELRREADEPRVVLVVRRPGLA